MVMFQDVFNEYRTLCQAQQTLAVEMMFECCTGTDKLSCQTFQQDTTDSYPTDSESGVNWVEIIKQNQVLAEPYRWQHWHVWKDTKRCTRYLSTDDGSSFVRFRALAEREQSILCDYRKIEEQVATIFRWNLKCGRAQWNEGKLRHAIACRFSEYDEQKHCRDRGLLFEIDELGEQHSRTSQKGDYNFHELWFKDIEGTHFPPPATLALDHDVVCPLSVVVYGYDQLDHFAALAMQSWLPEGWNLAIVPAVSKKPQWDQDRRELTFNGRLVKRYRVAPSNQERILAAFEEAAWSERIDNPLRGRFPNLKQLNDLIRSLNGCHLTPGLITFRSTGTGITWEVPKEGATADE